MAAKKAKFKKFEIPDEFLKKLYDLTGGVDKNKGYFVCYIDETNDVQICQKFDGQATEFAIMKGLEIFVAENSMSYSSDFDEDFDDEDEED